MSGLVGDRDALTRALDAGIREWEDRGGELLPILHRHASGAVIDVATLADDEALTAAIARIEESRESHVQWRDHLDACTYCREHPPAYVHGREEQAVIVAQYDGVLRILRALAERSQP